MNELTKIEGVLSGVGEQVERIIANVEEMRKQFKLSDVNVDRALKEISIAMRETSNRVSETNINLVAYRRAFKQTSVELKQAKKAHQLYNEGLLKGKKRTKEQKAALVELGRAVKNARIEHAGNVKALKNEITEQEKYRKSLIQQKDVYNQLTAAKKMSVEEGERSVGMFGRMGGAMKGLMPVANQLLGVFGMGLGLYGLVRALRVTASTIIDFEKEQKNLAAISGATEKEMAMLTRTALEVGAATKFGAVGVTQMQLQLSKMGFAVSEVNAMTRSISMLATAASVELEPAAEVVALMIRAFNLRADETARVTDTMAKSFNSTALDMAKFRESMKYIAPIAAQANFTIEDTTALLGRLANAGISGSLAGTSLRNVISQMSDETSNFSKRLGITINNFDDFIEGMFMLKEAGTDLGDVFQLMDRRASTAFQTILNNAKSVEDLRDSLRDAGGAAEEMANIQMQSLAMQAKVARNAWDSFVLSLERGSGVIPDVLKRGLGLFSLIMQDLTENMNKQSRVTKNEIANIGVLVDRVNSANLAFDDRVKALKQLQREYPQYFSDIREEILTNEDLVGSIGDINEKVKELRDTMEGKVILQIAEEDVNNQKKLLDRSYNLQVNAETKLQKQKRKIREKYDVSVDGSIEDIERQIREVGRYGVMAARELGKLANFERELAEARETYQRRNDELNEAVDNRQKEMFSNIAVGTDAFIGYLQDIEGGYEGWNEGINEIIKSYRELYKTIEEDPQISNMQAAEQARDQLRSEIEKDMLHYQWEIDLLERLEQADTKAHKTAVKNIEGKRLEYNALEDASGKYINTIRDENKRRASQIINEQKEAELRAQITYEGIALEEKLRQIRFKAANDLAELEGAVEEARLKNIAALENEIALQGIRAKLAREQYDLTEREIRQQQNLRKVMESIYDQDFAREEQGVGLTQRTEFEIRKQEELNRRVIEGIKETERQRIAALQVAFEQRVAGMNKETEEYKTLERQRNEELLGIEQEFAGRRIEQERKHQNAMLAEFKKGQDDRVAAVRQEGERVLAALAEQQKREMALFNSTWRSDSERREIERRHAQETIEEQERVQKAYLNTLKARRALLVAAGFREDSDVIMQMDFDISSAEDSLKTLTTLVNNPEFDMTEWNKTRDAIKKVFSDLSNAISKQYSEMESIAKRQRELMDRNVTEAQRAIEIELRLREQGFASNVQAKQQELEQMEDLRKKAQEAEERAMRQRMVSEAIMQSISIATAAAEMIKSQAKLGLPGIITAAGGIASIFALWRGVRQQSKALAKYEHGGHFLLQGNSHARGGVPLAAGHEAQGGEMVSVFSRSATRKYAPQIRSLTDFINSGKMLDQRVNVFAENKDIRKIRQSLEKSESYQGNYRIIKNGDHITRCRLN